MLRVPWDGLFLSPEPPWGASVIVSRPIADGASLVLLLGRRDGAGLRWSPPAVTRLPGEDVAACARRALDECAGLALVVQREADVDGEWALFQATAGGSSTVRVGAGFHEHEWVSTAVAAQRCPELLPASVDLVA